MGEVKAMGNKVVEMAECKAENQRYKALVV